MRNKIIIYCSILVFSTLSVNAAEWSLSDVGWSCSPNCCIAGYRSNVNLKIKNIDTNTITIDKIWIRDGTEKYICYKDLKPDLALSPGDSKSITMDMCAVPQATDNYWFKYDFTFYLKEDCLLCPWAYESSKLYSQKSFTIEQHECYTDNDCSETEYCKVSKIDYCLTNCVSVTQETSCGYISNHKWINYECCSDTDCLIGEICFTHECNRLSCPCGYISGHTCIKYECCSDDDCGSGKYCQNHKCYDKGCESNLDCDGDEKCQYYQCIKITCPSNQYAKVHKCIECESDPQCDDDESCLDNFCEKVVCEHGYYPANHQCNKYPCMKTDDCPDYEECKNNRCVAIRCEYCERPLNHRCVRYECCSDSECNSQSQCINHVCKNLQCADDQYMAQHTCRKLQCDLLYVPKNHKCELDTTLLVIIGVIVLLVIGGMGVRGFASFKHKKERKDKPTKTKIKE